MHIVSQAPHRWLALRRATIALVVGLAIVFVQDVLSAAVSARQTFDSIYQVVANPAGTRLAIGGTNGLLKIIDAETLADILIFPVVPWPVYGISWSPDGARVISSHPQDGAVRVWNAINGQLIRRIGLVEYSFGAVRTAWSSDGSYIAVRQDVSERSEIFIYDGTTYALICNVKPIRPLGTLAWRAGSNVLLVGSNNGLSVIDVSANCVQSPVPHRTESLTAISTPPTGNQVALGTGAGSVIIADSISLQASNTFQISSEPISSIGWSTDGTTIRVASQDKIIRIIDASDGSTLFSYPFTQIGGISSTALSPDGTRVIFGDGTVIRSEPVTRRAVQCNALRPLPHPPAPSP